MASDKAIWLGPEPLHVGQGPGHVYIVHKDSVEEHLRRSAAFTTCAMLGGACAYTRVEPKGLTAPERHSCEGLDKRYAESGWVHNIGALAIRLDTELSAALAMLEETKAAHEKSMSDCVVLAGRLPNAEKMQAALEEAKKERDYWTEQMSKMFRNLPQRVLDELAEQSRTAYHKPKEPKPDFEAADKWADGLLGNPDAATWAEITIARAYRALRQREKDREA